MAALSGWPPCRYSGAPRVLSVTCACGQSSQGTQIPGPEVRMDWVYWLIVTVVLVAVIFVIFALIQRRRRAGGIVVQRRGRRQG